MKTWWKNRKLRKVAKQLQKARLGIEFLIESTKSDKELAAIIGSELARENLMRYKSRSRAYATALSRGPTTYVKYPIPEGESVAFVHSQIEKGGVTKCQKSE